MRLLSMPYDRKSAGGEGSDVLAVGPSSTMNNAIMPIDRWNSKWQCMNHTPIYKKKEIGY
jgi:hypothetical protein